MPRFYFDVREGPRFTPDEEGLEFEDVDCAEREATIVAAEIGRDRFPRGHAREITVKVRNEQRQRLMTVRIAMQVDRINV